MELKDIEEQNRPSSWFPVKQRFVVELEFNEINDETAKLIIDSCIRNKELLPNLKVKRWYRPIETIESVFDFYKKQSVNQLEASLDNIYDTFKNKIESVFDVNDADCLRCINEYNENN